MFNNIILCTFLILLSATEIIFSIPVPDDYSEELTSTSTITRTSPVPEDFTTKLLNVKVCESGSQRQVCFAILQEHLNNDSTEYRQLQTLKDDLINLSLALPVLLAMRGYNELIQVLLRNGLPINKKYVSEYEATMLYFAARSGHDDLVDLLLNSGADTEIKNIHGNTPLHIAISEYWPTTVKLLLDAGADVNVTNNCGETPLLRAVHYLHYESLQQSGTYVSEELKKENNISVQDIIKYLLEHKPDINITDHQRNTVLHVAAQKRNLPIVKLLIDAGANINATNVNNQTPLHIAIMANSVPVAKYLVAMGADKTIADSDMKTALDRAKENNLMEIVDLLSREE